MGFSLIHCICNWTGFSLTLTLTQKIKEAGRGVTKFLCEFIIFHFSIIVLLGPTSKNTLHPPSFQKRRYTKITINTKLPSPHKSSSTKESSLPPTPSTTASLQSYPGVHQNPKVWAPSPLLLILHPLSTKFEPAKISAQPQ